MEDGGKKRRGGGKEEVEKKKASDRAVLPDDTRVNDNIFRRQELLTFVWPRSYKI